MIHVCFFLLWFRTNAWVCVLGRLHQDSSTSRKRAVSGEYQYMRDMLAREEQEALKSIDREVETGQTKIRGMVAKFNDNIDKMSKAKERIHRLLSRSHTQSFLQVGPSSCLEFSTKCSFLSKLFNVNKIKLLLFHINDRPSHQIRCFFSSQASLTLPQAVNYDPYSPRINLDSKKVMLSEAFAADMKNFLLQVLKQPMETRIQILRGVQHISPQTLLPVEARKIWLQFYSYYRK